MKNPHSTASGPEKPSKDKDGDDEMTVVVPPSKASKPLNSPEKEADSDVAMNGIEEPQPQAPDDVVDHPAKAVDGLSYLTLFRYLT